MTRRPLSAVTLVLVLAAVAPAGEPPRPPRPVVMRGQVVRGAYSARYYGYDLVLPETDRRHPGRRYPLMPTSDAHSRLIYTNFQMEREVEVVGDLYVIDGRYFIAIEIIKELP